MPTWRELRDIFRELQPTTEDGLYAQWFGESNRWELQGSPSDSVLRRFKQTSMQAARKATGIETWEAFLDALKKEEHTYREGGSVTVQDPTGQWVEHPTGEIPRLCEAAADYCEKCLPKDEQAVRFQKLRDKIESDLARTPPAQLSYPPAPTSIPTFKQESVAEQIDRLRLECEWTTETLAEHVQITPRSVYRHVAGDDVPSKLNIAKYERVFSERLERKVVISRTSVNVSKRQKKA